MLTVLCAPNVWASKGERPLRTGYWLQHFTLPATSFETLVGALEALKTEPNAYIIRGAVCDPACTTIRRRIRAPQFIEAQARQWLCVDIDALDIDTRNLPRAVARARALLPRGLNDAQCYYAVTGSTKPTSLHVHLWFWLERPYGGAELKAALRPCPVDLSLYQPVQPHFTALPTIENDVLVRRGILSGPPAKLGKPADVDPIAAWQSLERACAQIAKATKGARHAMINKSAYHLGALVASGALAQADVEQALFFAAETSGLSPERARDEIARGIADGIEVDRPQWLEKLHRTKDGGIRMCHANALIALSEAPEWAGAVGYDTRQGGPVWLRTPPRTGLDYADAVAGKPLTDAHATIAVQWLAGRGVHVPTDVAFKHLLNIAMLEPFDPVVEMLKHADHDGLPRLDTWLSRYFAAADTPYHRAVGKAWMISAVARAFVPGCKADYALILEALQGFKKSTALDVLAMGYCREVKTSLEGKDAQDALHNGGTWIASLTELAAIKRTSDVEALKAFITSRDDHYREAYSRVTLTRPRSIVFAGTTNADTYLVDSTGNRRWWPVRCRGIADIEALERDAEQLWAEAVQAYRDGAIWWLTPAEELALAAPEQDARMDADPWVDELARALNDAVATTTHECLDTHLAIPVERRSAYHAQRCGSALRRLGYVRCRARTERLQKLGLSITEGIAWVFVKKGSEW